MDDFRWFRKRIIQERERIRPSPSSPCFHPRSLHNFSSGNKSIDRRSRRVCESGEGGGWRVSMTCRSEAGFPDVDWIPMIMMST